MKKWIVLVLLVISFSARSQTGYFVTYEDFLKDSMQVMKGIAGLNYTLGKVTIIFENNMGKEEKIKAKSIWGFKYKDKLFRTDHIGNIAFVFAQANFIYYENGGAHLQMLLYNKNEGDFASGYGTYLSKDLGSEIFPLPSAPISDARKKYKDFKKQYPEFGKLYDCIGNKTYYLNVRRCVQEYLRDN